MRGAIFVAVLAAHVLLIWLFPSLRRLVLPPVAEELVAVPIYLPPLPESAIELSQAKTSLSPPTASAQEPGLLAWKPSLPPFDATPERKETGPADSAAGTDSAAGPDSPVAALLGPAPANPDWHAQAEVTARTNALHIIEDEDTAARRAAALTAPFKPLPGPRVRGPEFGWDYAPTHRITHAQGGGLVIALNDRCAIFIFLIPMIGCSIGHQPPPNGDLFNTMHKPVKFGDWDWRLDDP